MSLCCNSQRWHHNADCRVYSQKCVLRTLHTGTWQRGATAIHPSPICWCYNRKISQTLSLQIQPDCDDTAIHWIVSNHWQTVTMLSSHWQCNGNAIHPFPRCLQIRPMSHKISHKNLPQNVYKTSPITHWDSVRSHTPTLIGTESQGCQGNIFTAPLIVQKWFWEDSGNISQPLGLWQDFKLFGGWLFLKYIWNSSRSNAVEGRWH